MDDRRIRTGNNARGIAHLLCAIVPILAASLSVSGAASLDETLEAIRAKAHLPALAAAVVRSNTIVAAGAVGLLKDGSPEKVTVDDKFHIGSCTKSMTATLAGMLVEQGDLAWETTIGQAFPDWRATIHPAYTNVNLEQLLSHRGGVPGDLTPNGLWKSVWQHSSEPPTEQRIFLARELLKKAPATPPGKVFQYANAGYTIAGVMIEQREHKPWEELLTRRLFEPLGMKSAGFGAPATPGKVDQPWGHVFRDGKLVSIPPAPSGDNPAAIGPGGTVHCSVLDFARYANFHLQGDRGTGKLLKKETFAKLHTPIPGQEYALGWIVVQRPWAKGRALTHMGSNTMNTAVVWIAPEVDFAVVVMTNLGGKEAEAACDHVASALIGQFE